MYRTSCFCLCILQVNIMFVNECGQKHVTWFSKNVEDGRMETLYLPIYLCFWDTMEHMPACIRWKAGWHNTYFSFQKTLLWKWFFLLRPSTLCLSPELYTVEYFQKSTGFPPTGERLKDPIKYALKLLWKLLFTGKQCSFSGDLMLHYSV